MKRTLVLMFIDLALALALGFLAFEAWRVYEMSKTLKETNQRLDEIEKSLPQGVLP